ncbi:MAG: PorT family protein [Alistipes sp.]|nr:PorT family protein [Alistipes sp.]
MMRGIKYMVAVVAVVLALFLGSDRAVAQEYLYPFPEVEQSAGKVQMEWGVGVGAVYTGIEAISRPEIELNSHLAFQGHLDMAVVIGRYFAVESEIMFQKGKIDALYRDRLYEVSASTVEVPVMASLRLWDGMLRVSGGVSFGVLSSSGYLDGYESYMFGPITPTWNLTAGVGVYVARTVLVDLRYSHALQDNINQIGGARSEAGVDFATRTHKVSLGATILF